LIIFTPTQSFLTKTLVSKESLCEEIEISIQSFLLFLREEEKETMMFDPWGRRFDNMVW
jgi:hypothetical protein